MIVTRPRMDHYVVVPDSSLRTVRRWTRVVAAVEAIVGVALAVALDSKVLMLVVMAIICATILGPRIYVFRRRGLDGRS
jgi:lipopolysaccharide/colanic/teichoic acid biosynthesis glycosyltransferase